MYWFQGATCCNWYPVWNLFIFNLSKLVIIFYLQIFSWFAKVCYDRSISFNLLGFKARQVWHCWSAIYCNALWKTKYLLDFFSKKKKKNVTLLVCKILMHQWLKMRSIWSLLIATARLKAFYFNPSKLDSNAVSLFTNRETAMLSNLNLSPNIWFNPLKCRYFSWVEIRPVLLKAFKFNPYQLSTITGKIHSISPQENWWFRRQKS